MLLKHSEIAGIIGKRAKTVSEYLRRRGLKKCQNYTDTEIYILLHFDIKVCKQFIQHKSLNALKIKKWRLKNASVRNNI